jgi:hypothetical protein
MHQYAIPKLPSGDKNNFEEEIAMFFFSTGTPFSRIEDPHLTNACNILRPEVVLPHRKRLAGHLLNECYSKMKISGDRLLNDPDNIC